MLGELKVQFIDRSHKNAYLSLWGWGRVFSFKTMNGYALNKKIKGFIEFMKNNKVHLVLLDIFVVTNAGTQAGTRAGSHGPSYEAVCRS